MAKGKFRFVIVPNDAGKTKLEKKIWLHNYLEAKEKAIKKAAETAEEEKQRLAVLEETKSRVREENEALPGTMFTIPKTQFISADEFKKEIKGHDLSQLCFAIPFEFQSYFGSEQQENFSFRYATFLETADFSQATFSGPANFSRTTFSQKANFFGAIFLREADFSEANFSQPADFSGANFSQLATFQWAEFSQPAYFILAKFSERAYFSNATFSERADFSKANFSQPADFYNTTFSQLANFHDATFSKPANFSDATFSQKARFSKANFSQEASFFGATFKKDIVFFLAKFQGDINFAAAHFAANVYLDAAEINPEENFNFDAVSLDEKSQLFFDDGVLPQKATRSGARLLKEFFTKKQDQVLGDHFYRLEMDARLKNLSLFSKQGGEKVLLYVGWLTSNFGQSWIRPILCYLGFTHLFYAAALWGDASYSVICDNAYISKYLCQGPISLPEFTNPFSLTIPKQQVEVPRPVEGQVKAVLLQEKN